MTTSEAEGWNSTRMIKYPKPDAHHNKPSNPTRPLYIDRQPRGSAVPQKLSSYSFTLMLF